MASYPPMKLLSFFLEIMPLAGFFLGFELYGLFVAAIISLVLGVMVMGVNWIKTGRLARFALFSIVMSAGLTFAALYFNATIFIKLQPTIFNGLFATVLLGGLLVRRAMMREFFGTQFQLTSPTSVDPIPPSPLLLSGAIKSQRLILTGVSIPIL